MPTRRQRLPAAISTACRWPQSWVRHLPNCSRCSSRHYRPRNSAMSRLTWAMTASGRSNASMDSRRNGTTHVEWDPVDFIAKLAALVPPPRAHLTRFHGLLAPNANLRAQLTPSGRGKRPAIDAVSTQASSDHRTPDEKRRAMTWAQRLKRAPCPAGGRPCRPRPPRGRPPRRAAAGRAGRRRG